MLKPSQLLLPSQLKHHRSLIEKGDIPGAIRYLYRSFLAFNLATDEQFRKERSLDREHLLHGNPDASAPSGVINYPPRLQ